MTRPLSELERLVEREMDVLAELPAAPPSPDALRRTHALVRDEALRLGAPARRRPEVVRWLGTAASVLLAIGLGGVLSRSPTPSTPLPDEDLLDVWAEAVSDTSDRLAFLTDDGWMLEAAGDANGDSDTYIELLDASFDQLGSL
ncbi:MAG: hypothetical protein PVJ57_17035 [Phycisphaerae bacterium]|jgi:hypothetical protein